MLPGNSIYSLRMRQGVLVAGEVPGSPKISIPWAIVKKGPAFLAGS